MSKGGNPNYRVPALMKAWMWHLFFYRRERKKGKSSGSKSMDRCRTFLFFESWRVMSASSRSTNVVASSGFESTDELPCVGSKARCLCKRVSSLLLRLVSYRGSFCGYSKRRCCAFLAFSGKDGSNTKQAWRKLIN